MNRREMQYGAMLGIGSMIIVISFILYPAEVFHSSLRGLSIWWEVVFPSTLPFFVMSELLMGFGIAHFFGILLEPIMRPLFRVPGAGSFVLTMGFASGYPMAAKLTMGLRERGLISKEEGERLVAFTTTSDPLFIFGAVAVGFFQRPELGFYLALIHYGTAILVGLMMRFYPPKENPAPPSSDRKEPLFIRAFTAMTRARKEDGRTFGRLLSDAVSSSIQTLLLIGGLIMISSVFMRVLELLHVNLFIMGAFQTILSLFSLPVHLSTAFMNGLFEVTLGVKESATEQGGMILMHQIAAASAILAWGGLSVHAQIASILSRTDISYKPLLYGRLLHVGFATISSYLLWNRFGNIHLSLPAFLPHPFTIGQYGWENLSFSIQMALLFTGIAVGVILFASFSRIFYKSR